MEQRFKTGDLVYLTHYEAMPYPRAGDGRESRCLAEYNNIPLNTLLRVEYPND